MKNSLELQTIIFSFPNMADSKISQLTQTTNPSLSSYLPIVESATNKKTLLSNIKKVVGSSISTNITSKVFADSGYVATTSDQTIVWNTSGGNCVCFLPAVASVPSGTTFDINHLYSSTGTNTLTIDGNGTGTIDGELTQVLSKGTSATIQNFNQTEWLIK